MNKKNYMISEFDQFEHFLFILIYFLIQQPLSSARKSKLSYDPVEYKKKYDITNDLVT